MLFVWQSFYAPQPHVNAAKENVSNKKSLENKPVPSKTLKDQSKAIKSVDSQGIMAEVDDKNKLKLHRFILESDDSIFHFNSALNFDYYVIKNSVQTEASKKFGESLKQNFQFSFNNKPYEKLNFNIVSQTENEVLLINKENDLNATVTFNEIGLLLELKSSQSFYLLIEQTFSSESKADNDEPFFAIGLPENRSVFY